jgi:hypothetical protein
MSNANANDKQPDTKREPSSGPLKNEPTPERAAQEKQKQTQAQEAQAAEIAKPKPSGAV